MRLGGLFIVASPAAIPITKATRFTWTNLDAMCWHTIINNNNDIRICQEAPPRHQQCRVVRIIYSRRHKRKHGIKSTVLQLQTVVVYSAPGPTSTTTRENKSKSNKNKK